MGPSKEFTILLVDDKKENLIALEAMLMQPGRHFITASTGEDALQAVKQANSIGLIMLDVQMPGMDGFEVARMLKANEHTRDISIIFVTAINTEIEYALKGFEEGAMDYLQKPLDNDITRAKVNVFEKLYFYQRTLKDVIAEKQKINSQLERFTYTVAHDLKSPLSGIHAMISLLKNNQRVTAVDNVSEYLNITYRAVSHLFKIVDSLLEYSQKSIAEQTVEEVDTNELVTEISTLLFPPKHIAIKIADQLPVMATKKLKLEQVFQNLISNAIKYMDKEHGEIVIGAREKENFYEFYVHDNGPGIAQNDQKRIFKLFETGSAIAKTDSSTGVGLNVLKMLVEEQGGEIWVTSEPGKGSTFYFEWRKEH